MKGYTVIGQIDGIDIEDSGTPIKFINPNDEQFSTPFTNEEIIEKIASSEEYEKVKNKSERGGIVTFNILTRCTSFKGIEYDYTINRYFKITHKNVYDMDSPITIAETMPYYEIKVNDELYNVISQHISRGIFNSIMPDIEVEFRTLIETFFKDVAPDLIQRYENEIKELEIRKENLNKFVYSFTD